MNPMPMDASPLCVTSEPCDRETRLLAWQRHLREVLRAQQRGAKRANRWLITESAPALLRRLAFPALSLAAGKR
jgi:hypothetical protein